MMWIILLAAIAMIFQDILEVLKDQSQARNRAVLAGVFDTLMWLCLITSTTVSVTALQGHKLSEKIIVIVAISVANFVGQYSGVYIGKKYIKEIK